MRSTSYLIIFVTYFLTNLEQCMTWKKGTQFAGWVLPTWVQTTEIPWKSDDECYVRCAQNSTCTGLYYNENTRQCLHFQEDYFELWEGFTGDFIVFFAPMKVVMVTIGSTYALDFAAAGSTCGSLRGRLITLTEMVDLWDVGFEMCNCGWIAEGINVMSEQFGCGANPQVADCALALAHAFCILN